jgi:hypothetical protein
MPPPLEEQIIRNDGVGGSNPSCGTNNVQQVKVNKSNRVLQLRYV